MRASALQGQLGGLRMRYRFRPVLPLAMLAIFGLVMIGALVTGGVLPYIVGPLVVLCTAWSLLVRSNR